MLLSQLYQDLIRRLKIYPFIDQPQLEAKIILTHTLNLSNEDFILALSENDINQAQLNIINKLVLQREKGKSIAAIINNKYFYDLSFYVNNDVLIPRPETELLIDVVINVCSAGHTIHALDIGAGSGAIALTLAHHLPELIIDALEISEKACKVFMINLEKYSHLKKNINLIHQNFFKYKSKKQYDLIISNPPYIPSATVQHLKANKLVDDPIEALDGGEDGLVFYEEIVIFAEKYLRAEGFIILEHGYDQKNQIISLFPSEKYENQSFCDLAGLDRVLLFKKK